MKYLVTGGAGFIGSNIVEELLGKGESVRVLDNFSTGKRENLKGFEKDIDLIEGDIRSYDLVENAVEGIDIILHQAALSSVHLSVKEPSMINEVNINGTLNLLIAGKNENIKRLVFASSAAVYGDSQYLPNHEFMTPNPLSPYAVSKLAGENYCKVFSKIFGLETICLRYFNVFGPKQDSNSEYSAVIPKFIKLISNNQRPTVYGDGTQSRDYTYVTNIVDANLLSATKKIETPIVMNCACQRQISLNELIKCINESFNKNVEPLYSDHKPGDIQHSFANINLIKEKLNFIPKDQFIDGLKLLINRYI